MRSCRLTYALLLAALTVPMALVAQGTDEVGLPVGTKPAAVQIEDLDGHAVDLSQYGSGKPVLMEFWATWCEVCKALHPSMVAAQKRFGDQVDFLSVSVAVNQTPRSIKRYLERHPVPGRVLWDVGGRATRAYEAPTTSYVIILDAAGRVAYTGVGADQDLEAALEKVVGSATEGQIQH
ncbi:MAG: TlpA family protein disulfide reductase [Gemmatimonadales bacterium]